MISLERGGLVFSMRRALYVVRIYVCGAPPVATGTRMFVFNNPFQEERKKPGALASGRYNNMTATRHT
jgi:hypothetical protein